MKGRKPTPAAVLKCQGTFRGDRHGARAKEPAAPAGPLDPPDFCTEGQSEIWRTAVAHAPRGMLAPIDRVLLFAYVAAADQLRTAARMQAEWDRDSDAPLLLEGRGGVMTASPYIRIIRQAAETIAKIGSELAFSPAARARHGAPEPMPPTPSGPDDPWQKLKQLQAAGQRNKDVLQ